MVRSKRASKRRFVCLLILVAISTTILLWPRHSPAWAGRGDKNAIYTCVFQRMMARRQRPYTGLSIGAYDPDAAVLKNFRNNTGVIPGSRITVGPSGAFVDKKTGGDAEAFSVSPDSLRWYGPALISVDADAHGSGSDGYLGTYYLARKGGRWVVTGYRDSGIMF